ncbi:glycosyltransferase [Sphingobium rhizovicinum]|uniref:Glycosyltransferase n=1 Tax=Sphingobium rhizovicinum TaxID=432308 RepID=A0ABV7NCE3_9SPHN
MHVSIAIVAFRNAQEIAACLEGLARSTHQDFDVVICENGGPQAYAALQAAVPTRLPGGQVVETILAPGNLGYAGGVNVCMRARLDADGWWIVNPDTVPDPDALAALIARLAQGDCAAVGGVLHDVKGRIQAYGGRWHAALARAESIGNGAALTDRPDAAAIERQMNYLLGASMLIGRVFVDKVGLMREDYFLYAEEVEWCLRAGAAGLKLGFAPDARVCHDQGGRRDRTKLIAAARACPSIWMSATSLMWCATLRLPACRWRRWLPSC